MTQLQQAFPLADGRGDQKNEQEAAEDYAENRSKNNRP
jgi:hypothetical protein